MVFDIARYMNPPKPSKVIKSWLNGDYPCRIVQGPFSINGYVGVPKNHPDYGKEYDDVEVEVHGGLTFCVEGKDGDDLFPFVDVWWFGFDTAHGFSGMWTEDMVINESNRLAEQLSVREVENE